MQTYQTLVNSLGTRLFRAMGIQRLGELGKPNSLGVWLPLVLGTILGILAAVLILQQNWITLLAIMLVVPSILLFLVLFFRYPFITVIIWLLVFPFVLREVLPGARIIYWLLHRAMIPGALFTLIILSIFGIRKVKPFRLGLADAVMVTYLVYSVGNILLLSAKTIPELIAFYDRIFVPLCMYWLVRLIKPAEVDLRRLAPVAIIIIFSQGTVGALSWFAPHVLPPQWLGRVDERTVGTFGNPGVFTTTLLFCALILAQTSWQDTRRASRKMPASLLVVAIAFFFVFFSFSRGSWLGAIPVWIGLFILYPRPMVRLSLIGSIALVPLLGFGPLAKYATFAEDRLFTESTADGRIIGGAASLRMVEEKPVFGWGYGNHELYDEQFRVGVLGLAVNKQQSSHNTYFLIAAEMGIPGLILYFIPTVWLLYLTIKYWRWLPETRIGSRSFVLMLWLLIFDHALVGLFTDMIQSNFFNTTLWWMVLGFIANAIDAGRDSMVLSQDQQIQKIG